MKKKYNHKLRATNALNELICDLGEKYINFKEALNCLKILFSDSTLLKQYTLLDSKESKKYNLLFQDLTKMVDKYLQLNNFE